MTHFRTYTNAVIRHRQSHFQSHTPAIQDNEHILQPNSGSHAEKIVYLCNQTISAYKSVTAHRRSATRCYTSPHVAMDTRRKPPHRHNDQRQALKDRMQLWTQSHRRQMRIMFMLSANTILKHNYTGRNIGIIHAAKQCS